MKSLIKLNLLFFALYILAQALNIFEGFLLFRIIRSLIDITAILIIFGLNIAALMQIIFKRDFDFWEFFSIASVSSLILAPLLLTLEYGIFKRISPQFPAINSFLVFLIMALAYYLKKGGFAWESAFVIKKITRQNLNALFSSPLFWVSILYVSVIIIIFSAYYTLPDLDPYYWLYKYSNQFKSGSLELLSSQRPLFSSLIYILNQGTHIDLYATFKYIIPALSVLLLIPAWLVAKIFSSKIQRVIILMMPMASSSTILYSQTPMPQAILIILVVYFFFFLIYSWMLQKTLFYYLGGIAIALGYFYQEAAAIIFAIWLAVTAVSERNKIRNKIKSNKLTALLIAIIILTNINFIKMPFEFLFSWLKILATQISLNFNFLFPAYYVNADGNSMGWGDFLGVIKYYLYYSGIPAIVSLLFGIYLAVKNSNFRKYIKNETRDKKEIMALFLVFLTFFLISEIFPRLFNIALLPERGWIFGGIAALALFFLIIKFYGNLAKKFYYLMFLGILISVTGAIYINNFKKYTITSTQLYSAEWIKSNLPNNRFFFTARYSNLLKFHAQSGVIKIPVEFFFDHKLYESYIASYKQQRPDLFQEHKKYLMGLSDYTRNLEQKNPQSQKNEITALISQNIEYSKNFLNTFDSADKISVPQNLYIYYAKPSDKNPYLSRPYTKSENGNGSIIFDNNPDKFQKVHADEENKIFIWKIL